MREIRKVAAVLSVLAGPLSLTACSSGNSGTTTAPTAVPSSGGTWILYASGSVTPSPVPSVVSATTPGVATLSPRPSGSSTPTPSGSACNAAAFVGGNINGLGVTAGTTSAVLTWFNPGGSTLVSYKLTAANQDLKTGRQQDVGYTTVTPTACGWMTGTVKNLTSKTHYVFSVDAQYTKNGVSGTYTRTIARSGVVSTT
ncbi:fibronectin type III domain-containing protein [Actinoplanes sp. NPDC051851]|uniref:fibronectin type III domain-containing protein n=1 Tax=Actinoplanes sp. NPDC051851 TaxID=3154753 RepID=UPI003435D907